MTPPGCRDCAYMLMDKSPDRTPRCFSPHTREHEGSFPGVRCNIERAAGACGEEGKFFERRTWV